MTYFISLGNELKPEPLATMTDDLLNFISLGNELKPELSVLLMVLSYGFYIVRKRA